MTEAYHANSIGGASCDDEGARLGSAAKMATSRGYADALRGSGTLVFLASDRAGAMTGTVAKLSYGALVD